ncbi:phosphatidylserine decarboxylase-domain-containing protein [Chiua virens]|nr:phosphatidylserine decarboxylase-domain-containing protein [Chiua virens]
MLYKVVTKGKLPFQACLSLFVKRRISLSGTVRSLNNRAFKRSFSVKNVTPPESSDQLPGASTAAPLYRKIITAWTQTPTKWYPLPLAVGALLLVALQYHKSVARAQKEVHVDEDGREVIKLKGPWQVHVIGALPLRNLSRVWGYLNSFELPLWFRPYGFRFYATIEPSDLTKYASLGDFFYRKLKPGARPVDSAVLVSPADGTVLHFGTIDNLHVEQVKGITYSLDALLGVERHDPSGSSSPTSTVIDFPDDQEFVDHREFAIVNGIEYSLDQLLGAESPSTPGSAESG